MLIELLGANIKPCVINTESIVRLVRDQENPGTHTYIVLLKGDNYKVKHSYDSLMGVLDVKRPFIDVITTEVLQLEREQTPQTAVNFVATTGGLGNIAPAGSVHSSMIYATPTSRTLDSSNAVRTLLHF